jgi:hypothetical protein
MLCTRPLPSVEAAAIGAAPANPRTSMVSALTHAYLATKCGLSFDLSNGHPSSMAAGVRFRTFDSEHLSLLVLVNQLTDFYHWCGIDAATGLTVSSGNRAYEGALPAGLQPGHRSLVAFRWVASSLLWLAPLSGPRMGGHHVYLPANSAMVDLYAREFNSSRDSPVSSFEYTSTAHGPG